MSMGCGGACRKYSENESCVAYEYYAYNLNEERFINKARVYDGVILINKSTFVEPDIHQKIKKKPNGKKMLVTKRIKNEVPYDELLASGLIEIQNSSFCSKFSENGYGITALALVRRIFILYQETGEIANEIHLYW